MGIAYVLIRTSPETIEMLRDRPQAVSKFINQDDEFEPPRQGILSKLLGKAPAVDSGPVPDRTDDDETDLDKSWHIVHYLLCGETGRGDGPLAIIGDDLNPLADVKIGLGKPNLISPDRVRAFAEAASGMSTEQFLARYVPDEMPLDDLYMGEVIKRGDVEEIQEYAVEHFEILQDFARQASDRGEAIITYYC